MWDQNAEDKASSRAGLRGGERVLPDGDCYTCHFTVPCAPRRKKKMKALKMSHSVKGLYEKVPSFLSAQSLQKLFTFSPHNSCSGLIP